MKKFVFYRATADIILEHSKEIAIPSGLTFETWKPTIKDVYPRGLQYLYGKRALILWWVLQYLINSERIYKIFLIYRGKDVVHYTFLFSKNFRCPFMEKTDAKLGHTWTHELYRGKGFAGFAVKKLVEPYKGSGKNFWWYCGETNEASNCVARKLGFTYVGTGILKLRLGLRSLRHFRIIDIVGQKG